MASIFDDIPSNATCTLQKLTTTITSGGKVRSWTDRATGVSALITQQSPDGEAAQRHTVTMDTAATTAAEVGVGDRVLVTASDIGHLAGLYLGIDGKSRHAAADVPPFTRLQTTQRLESWVPA